MQFIVNKWISIIYRHSQIFYRKQFEKLNLSYGQPILLCCVCEQQGLSQDKLAEELAMNKSTVARMIYQLEQDGLIQKNVNIMDNRIFNIYPTDKALELYPNIIQMLDEWNIKLTENLDDKEIEVFESMLKKITFNAVKYAKLKCCETKREETVYD